MVEEQRDDTTGITPHYPSIPEGDAATPAADHNAIHPSPSASIRVHLRSPPSPSATPKALCHKARGCAVPGATPGSGHIAFPTPQGVVPFVPAGGGDKQGRNGIVFAGAEEEYILHLFPISM